MSKTKLPHSQLESCSLCSIPFRIRYIHIYMYICTYVKLHVKQKEKKNLMNKMSLTRNCFQIFELHVILFYVLPIFTRRNMRVCVALYIPSMRTRDSFTLEHFVNLKHAQKNIGTVAKPQRPHINANGNNNRFTIDSFIRTKITLMRKQQ